MIDWTVWRPALLDLVSSLATEGMVDVQNSESKQPFIDPGLGLSMKMRVATVGGVARDEQRYTFDAGKNVLTEEIHGQRRVTAQIRFECQEDEDSGWAFTYSEKVRTRLRRQSSLDALLAINTAIIEILPTQNFSDANDGHAETVAQFDLILAVGFQDDNPMPAGTGWIDAIHYTSRIADGAGTVLPVPPNVTAAPVP